jgi:hypothetical protein
MEPTGEGTVDAFMTLFGKITTEKTSSIQQMTGLVPSDIENGERLRLYANDAICDRRTFSVEPDPRKQMHVLGKIMVAAELKQDFPESPPEA